MLKIMIGLMGFTLLSFYVFANEVFFDNADDYRLLIAKDIRDDNTFTIFFINNSDRNFITWVLGMNRNMLFYHDLITEEPVRLGEFTRTIGRLHFNKGIFFWYCPQFISLKDGPAGKIVWELASDIPIDGENIELRSETFYAENKDALNKIVSGLPDISIIKLLDGNSMSFFLIEKVKENIKGSTLMLQFPEGHLLTVSVDISTFNRLSDDKSCRGTEIDILRVLNENGFSMAAFDFGLSKMTWKIITEDNQTISSDYWFISYKDEFTGQQWQKYYELTGISTIDSFRDHLYKGMPKKLLTAPVPLAEPRYVNSIEP
ncbi:MAG: hypothetical protein VB042_02980 [Victivallaceae bacterium]|nr:hypothetical protein [Victivallaceae bacterium]